MSKDSSGFVFRDPQTNLYVRDVEQAAAFYRDLFGFTESFRTPTHGPPDHIELRLGSFVLGFASIETARTVHGIDAKDGPAKGEIVFWTDDVDGAFEELTKKGARIVSPPHNFVGTLRAAWLMDPDGNNIQIVKGQFKN